MRDSLIKGEQKAKFLYTGKYLKYVPTLEINVGRYEVFELLKDCATID